MMIATVPFVAVGFLFSLTAEEASLGRKTGKKETPKDEEAPAVSKEGNAAEAAFPPEKVSGENVNV